MSDEFTYEGAPDARRIVNGLLESGGLESPEVPPGVSILDMQEDVEAFTSDLRIARDYGLWLPGVEMETGPPIPAGISSVIEPLFPLHWAPFEWSRERVERALESLRDRFGRAVRLHPEEARKYFEERATEFLEVRLRAPRGKKGFFGGGATTGQVNLPPSRGRPPAPTAGCVFSVHTNNPGLRVFWAGAYYIRRPSGNYFGHPTSPATSVMQSGSYIFGVDGGAYGSNVRWDTQAVCTLPGPNSVHLNY